MFGFQEYQTLSFALNVNHPDGMKKRMSEKKEQLRVRPNFSRMELTEEAEKVCAWLEEKKINRIEVVIYRRKVNQDLYDSPNRRLHTD